jgi:glucan phosphoethanolaminetransferase (alkaline phosphatase superfamily)
MTHFVRHPLKTLLAYWFSPMPAERLAAVRCCVGLFALWYFGRRIGLYSEVARGQSRHFDPKGLAGFLDAPIPPLLIDVLFALMLLLIVFFIVGWRYRIIAPLLALLSLFLISYRNSWSMVYHTDNAM